MIAKLKNIWWLVGAWFVTVPASALAQSGVCGPGKEVNGVCIPARPTGAPDFNTLGDLVSWILNIAISVVGLISVIFIVIGGYKYVTAGGDEEQIQSAKSTIMNALIGIVIVLLALAVVRITANLVGGKI